MAVVFFILPLLSESGFSSASWFGRDFDPKPVKDDLHLYGVLGFVYCLERRAGCGRPVTAGERELTFKLYLSMEKGNSFLLFKRELMNIC